METESYWWISIIFSVILSVSGWEGYAAVATIQLGGPGFTPVYGDYDGDGKTDPAAYQESTGYCQVLLSDSGYAREEFSFGGPGYLPVIGDYDADGKADFMLYDAGSWLLGGRMSTNAYTLVIGYFVGPGYRPVQ